MIAVPCAAGGQTSMLEHAHGWAKQEVTCLLLLGTSLQSGDWQPGTSVPCPLCNRCTTLPCTGATGSCWSPWEVPRQQTPTPSPLLSPTVPRGTAEGSSHIEPSLFLNPPLRHLLTAAVTSKIRHISGDQDQSLAGANLK